MLLSTSSADLPLPPNSWQARGKARARGRGREKARGKQDKRMTPEAQEVTGMSDTVLFPPDLRSPLCQKRRRKGKWP